MNKPKIIALTAGVVLLIINIILAQISLNLRNEVSDLDKKLTNLTKQNIETTTILTQIVNFLNQQIAEKIRQTPPITEPKK